jgi:hypothetical protein
MEFTFTPLRTAILIGLLAGFWLLGGFEFPGEGHRHLTRAWLYAVLLFSLGTVSSTVVDHWVGNLDRSNLRWLYIVLGVLCMGGGLMYQHVLKERIKIDKEAIYLTALPGTR